MASYLANLKSGHNSDDFIHWRNLTAAWLSLNELFIFIYIFENFSLFFFGFNFLNELMV